jgi:AcrR family transcriptional regulator
MIGSISQVPDGRGIVGCVDEVRARAKKRSDDKRGRIVAAATVLFSRYGYKRTSIDLLAAEAKVAKPTVYAYFADKEAVFTAVVEHVAGLIHADAEAAAAGPEPVEERLAAMLSAKHTRYWELVHASPHAAELVDSQDAVAARVVERADRAYLRLLTGAIEGSALEPARAGLTPAAAAQLLVRATSGAAYDATSAAVHRRHVGEIVRVLCRGMR